MPDVIRYPLRMECGGIDLVHPLDRMPEGYFPYLFNARVIQEGIVEGRPGYSSLFSLAGGDIPNSIRRLNDPDNLWSAQGYTYVGGGSARLYAGNETTLYAPIDTGYSGDPLSLIPFKPEQSPSAWMYVFDKNKQSKVRTDGTTLRAVGVVPPNDAPATDYGVPAWVTVNAGQSAAGWAAAGAASAVTLTDRTNGTAPTITSITYNSGTMGWCCINPAISQPFWMGERMNVILNSGGGNAETVVVREIHNAISATTIQAIRYDSGVTGPCAMVLNNCPPELARNSLISIGGEVIRVLAVINSPDSTQYSLRCSTAGTKAVGNAVTGLLSWYVYTTVTHVAAETITSQYLQVTQGAAGSGQMQFTGAINASIASFRPIDPANDYLHVSIFLQNPQNVASLQLLLTMDATPNFSFANPGNSYLFTVTSDQLQGSGASSGSWAEVVIPISSGARYGVDLTRNLSSITGAALQLTTTDACNWGFDWWDLFGTYGPTIQPNSPVGMNYESRYRDSSTGAKSIPGPLTLYPLFPLRESVIITPPASAQSGVDSIDIYRIGGTVDSPLYVGTIINNSSSPNSYTDALTDVAVLSINQPPDLTAIQPWPVLDNPWLGTCSICGTTVTWLTGTLFNTALLNNSIIILAGQAFQLYGSPRSSTMLELTQDAGVNTNASFQVSSPTLAGQPLPFVFGSLEGPFAPVVFALGDLKNAGTLYFSNFSDLDSASDANILELTSPSTGLVSGAVWKGMGFAGSREEVFCVRYSYLTTIGASSNNSFQWSRIDSPSGIWSRWACCSTPVGVAFLGQDGIYLATDSGAVSITDELLYPLFPHDGQAATQVNRGGNIILPVDMTQFDFLRLTYCDESIHFSYVDTGGNWNTLIYEIYKKRWLLNNYAHNLNMQYLVEGSNALPTDTEILALDFTANSIVKLGGNTDGGTAISSLLLTPSLDNGDERSQKLYVDTMHMADGVGVVSLAFMYSNSTISSAVSTFTATGGVDQFLVNIASQSDLTLYRNIACKYSWAGGPAGPRLWAFEYSGFLQPYVSTRFVTQYLNLAFPGWKHMRRMFPALISNSSVIITFLTQDGRTFGPYAIASTGGRYRQFPQMLGHGLKDLAFSIQVDGQGNKFAIFPGDFVVEVKDWNEETYIDLAVFKS